MKQAIAMILKLYKIMLLNICNDPVKIGVCFFQCYSITWKNGLFLASFWLRVTVEHILICYIPF